MAALVVGLRLRQLGRTLTRSPWAIVTLVLTAIAALLLLGLLTTSVLAVRLTAPAVAPDLLVLVGAAIVVGWAVGALLVAGDDALAPELFALLPVRPRRLLPAVLLAGAVGIGGIATAIALVVGLVGWSVDPGALAAAAITAPLLLATAVLAGRAVSAGLGRQLANRRARDLVLVLGTLLLIASGVLLQGAIAGLAALGSAEGLLAAVADAVAWTPLGAAWGVPLAIAHGEPIVAAGRLLVALATLAALWWVWASAFSSRLVQPVVASGGGAVRSGHLLDRLLPATPTGAVAARGIRYRLRDPRHIVNVLGVALMPLVLLGAGLASGAPLGPAVAFAPAIASLVVSTSVQLDTAYDKDALSLHVHAGVRGAADRGGRLLSMGVLLLPLLVVACVACALVAGRLDLLPASLGATLGTALVVAGVGTAISPWLPGQAPAPGASPFGRGSSGGGEAFVGLLAMGVVGGILSLPAVALAIAAVWLPWLGWASLAAAVVVGGLAVWGGVAIAGRAIDRRWPELLAAVSREG